VPAAFERALDDSQRSVVILFPVPDHANYGSQSIARNAISSSLSEMAQIAVACMHARGGVMADPAKKARLSGLQRYGLGAFSGGGDSMWLALQAAVNARGGRTKIRELYAFDANGWPAQQSDPEAILSAARLAGNDFRLRVTPTNVDKARLTPFVGRMETSAHPDLTKFPDFFDMKKRSSGLSSWYWHYVQPFFDANQAAWLKPDPPERLTVDEGARHQFAIFGGEDSTSGWTFLRKFLDVSAF
jgi:hypothetical protein